MRHSTIAFIICAAIVSPAFADETNNGLYISAEQYCAEAQHWLNAAPTIDEATLRAIRDDLEEIKARLEAIRVSERNYPRSDVDMMRPIRNQ